VWRTDDGGRTFHRPVAVGADQYVDHPWLAVDPTAGPAGGDLYVVWVTRHTDRRGHEAEGVAFSRSVDGGRTFAPPRMISMPSGGVTAPVGAAGPGGAVYVAYVTATSGTAPTLVVALVASADHGRTFVPAVTLGPTVFGLTPQPDLTLPSGPMVAIAPHDGTVYVVYAAGRPGGAGQSAADLVLAHSRDAGRTWATTVLVRAARLDAGVAFQPQVAVDAAETVAVSYLRLVRWRVAALLAQSTAHGRRFGAPRRITTRAFDPTLGLPGDKEGLCWIGDYQGLAAGPGHFYPCWGDTRTGHLQIVTATVPAAA
jgi:hypothetical protein